MAKSGGGQSISANTKSTDGLKKWEKWAAGLRIARAKDAQKREQDGV